ncbi:MAG: leucine-rich repeat domain-containing protein, partial [Bacteroides sp.]|nr:leucine-rich repeat domain-containing protein [Bacteroides sp.]
MKRTIAKFGMTMAMLLSFLPVFADNINVGKLYYTILSEKDGTVEVTKTLPYSSGDIEIPNEINYNNRIYTVTSIGNSAFKGRSSLTSVTIPDAVTSIGYS